MAQIGVVEFLLRARDDASGALAKVSGHVDKLGKSLTGLRAGNILAAAAASAATIGATLTAAAVKFGNTAEELDRTAKMVGVSVEEWQVYRKIVRDAGGDQEALQTAMVRFRRSMAENRPALRALGIDTDNTGEAFKKFLGILAKSDNEKARIKLLFDTMGRGAGELIPHLDDLINKFDEVRETSHSIVDEEAIRRGVALDDQIDKLHDALTGLGNAVAKVGIPIALPIIAEFTKWAEAAESVAKWLDKINAGKKAATALDAVGRMASLASPAGLALTQANIMRGGGTPMFMGNTEDADAFFNLFKPKAPMQGAQTREEWLKEQTEITRKAREEADAAARAYDELQRSNADKSRQKAINDLAKVLGSTNAVAGQLFARLEKIESTDKLEKIAKQLREISNLTIQQKALVDAFAIPLPEARKIGPESGERRTPDQPKPSPREQFFVDPKVSEAEIQKMNEATDEWIEKQEKVGELWTDLQMRWVDLIAEESSALTLLSDMLSGIGTSIEGMLNRLGQGLLMGMRRTGVTLRGIWKAMWDDMIRYAIAALARLGTAKILGFILSLLPGGKAIGAAAGTVLGIGGEDTRARRVIVAPLAAQAAQDALAQRAVQAAAQNRQAQTSALAKRVEVNVTNNITGLDSRDILNALESSSGSLRRAMSAAALSGAF